MINALTEGKGTKHINYRDSRLTRLLAAALGGNAKTLMITCVSPASGNLSESQSTLKFATRAKKIVNTVSKNEVHDMKNLAELQKQEIEKLKSELMNKSVQMTAEAEQQLKEKALGATRAVRKMKFLMLHAAAVIKALHKEGQGTLAKKVQSDIHQALAGTKDLSEVMDEITVHSTTHLHNNERIMKSIQMLERENDSLELDVDDKDEPAGNLYLQ